MGKEDTFNKKSEEELLCLIKQGNQLAFNHIYNKYWKRLFAYAYNILNEKDIVEDALHEVFIKIWTNRVSIEISNLESYLFVSVRNKSISLFGKVQFTEFDESIMDDLSFSPSEEEDDLRYQKLSASIEEVSKELPERCREIFMMSRYQGYSNEEIASYYEISHRTVENQLSIALKHIRKSISKPI